MDSASASERSSPQLSVKAGNGTGTLQPNLANMSKEEKEKEMARRREERKAVSRFLPSIGSPTNVMLRKSRR